MRASSTSPRRWRRVTFTEAIDERTGIDVIAHRDVEQLAAAIAQGGPRVPINGDTWFQLADDLLSKLVEPTLRSRPS